MKVLNQQQMDHVSGAGSEGISSVNYNDYDNFTDYLSSMKNNHLDALSVNVPGLRSAFNNWCKENRLDARYTARVNGWCY